MRHLFSMSLLVLLLGCPMVSAESAAATLSSFCRESEAIASLSDTALASLPESSFAPLVQDAMTRGWFDLCRNLLLHGRERKIDLTSAVYRTKSAINAHLKAMTNALRGQAVSTVAPAFEWAQDDDVVAINVKLAHKLDTPATLDCKSTDKMIQFGHVEQEGNGTLSYTFLAECAKSSKKFLLNLNPLWAGVVQEGSTWEYGSVGRVTLRLQKAVKQRTWPQLLSTQAKRPSNMHKWWKMQQHFDEAKTAQEEAAKKAKEEEEKKAKEEQDKKAKEEEDKKAKEEEEKGRRETAAENTDEDANAEAQEEL